MDQIYTLAIVEPNDLFRRGLSSVFDEPEWTRVVAEVRSLPELLPILDEADIDLVVLDPCDCGADRADAIERIHRADPSIRIMALSSDGADEVIYNCLQSGANGFLCKDASSEEVLLGARSVLQGQTFLSPNVLGKVAQGYVEGRRRRDPRTLVSSLTQRERQLFELVGQRHKNHEIAELLHISMKTVEKHRAAMMRKLRLGSPSDVRALWADYSQGTSPRD